MLRSVFKMIPTSQGNILTNMTETNVSIIGQFEKTVKSSNPIKNVLKYIKNNPKTVFTGGINFVTSVITGIVLDHVVDKFLMDPVIRPGMNFVLSPIEENEYGIFLQ